jgi:threonine aldolase
MSASSRIMEILLNMNTKDADLYGETYMFLNFEDTITDTLSLMQQFLTE